MKLSKWFPGLLCVAMLFSLGFAPRADEGESYWARLLRRRGRMNLPVDVLQQMKVTSCGEAVITMAYNYAYPEDPIEEKDVIKFAEENGYYTEKDFPFTSPANMVHIATHYSENVSTGTVQDVNAAMALLVEKLTGGDPVIIDILTVLDDPDSGAHFVVVTGLAIDRKNPNRTRILFNDPQTGTNRWGYWLGAEGVWNAWQNNGDPGGSGWWMVIPSP